MPYIVSIIVPAYNCGKTINQTINSILQQSTIAQKEIIIINDGSTDNTAHILNQWQGNPQFIIHHTKNQGASAARELGRHLASGQYIKYLDSDDLLLPNSLALQVEALQKSKADICYGKWQKFREVEGEIQVLETMSPHLEEDTVHSTFTTFWCPPAALLFTREIVDKIGPWPDQLPIIQDARYLQNAAMAGARFVEADAIVAQYRVSDTSLSNRHGELKFYQDVYRNTLNVWQIWQQRYPQPQYRSAIVETLRNCAKVFIQHDRALFDQCITELLKIEPHYIPKRSASMRFLSQLFGFRQASIWIHRLKQLLGQ
ncbi:glycosyltransferase family 2 protein [Haliscomenobacter hydrossis]|uniref:Glycosyl transferase family 2 n=1 Tax=Haliscomenobacter hydrossis (strain ATCC 27775 / DSM 1100 / LMG 10767 / O) TaxID=760192 RepID=F4L442_HALH1|nr:glycosyltransferase family A protein [Haliscomenobacter hydrossis]AEE50740.1 glycosyl transferase family 2 [Haliscomenobacter hydrossis DSM 1100]